MIEAGWHLAFSLTISLIKNVISTIFLLKILCDKLYNWQEKKMMSMVGQV